MTVEADTIAALGRARAAAPRMAIATTAEKNDFLRRLASAIRESRAEIIRANAIDLERARKSGRGGAFVERLTLDDKRIEAMAAGVLQVEALDDPVGSVIEKWTRPNGLKIEKIRVPIGVIAMIYESRPNVTVDAAALTLKAGNAVVLRGGSEALSSNGFLAGLDRARVEGRGTGSRRGDVYPRSGSRSNPDHEAQPRADRHDNSARRQVVEGRAGGLGDCRCCRISTVSAIPTSIGRRI